MRFEESSLNVIDYGLVFHPMTPSRVELRRARRPSFLRPLTARCRWMTCAFEEKSDYMMRSRRLTPEQVVERQLRVDETAEEITGFRWEANKICSTSITIILEESTRLPGRKNHQQVDTPVLGSDASPPNRSDLYYCVYFGVQLLGLGRPGAGSGVRHLPLPTGYTYKFSHRILFARKQIRTMSALFKKINSSNSNRILSSREFIILSDSNFCCVWGSCAVCCGLFSHEARHTARTQHSTDKHSTVSL